MESGQRTPLEDRLDLFEGNKDKARARPAFKEYASKSLNNGQQLARHPGPDIQIFQNTQNQFPSNGFLLLIKDFGRVRVRGKEEGGRGKEGDEDREREEEEQER